MSPNFVIHIGLPTPLDSYEAAPICPPVRRVPTLPPAPKAVAEVASEPRVTECASPARCEALVKALSAASHHKLSISRSRLDALENGLLVTFGIVTALLAATITTLPS